MAYYLQFDGSNDRVTIQCQATSSESWSLEWQLFAIPTPDSFGFARIFGGATAAEPNNRISSQIGGGDVSARFGGTNKIWSGKTFTNTDKFRIEYNGAQLELFINDVSQGAIAGTVTANFGLLGCNSNFYTNIALKYVTFTNITTPSKSRDYQPSLSGGTGSTLTDAANGVNGTLVNFPADNSQWVFYESGEPEPNNYEITPLTGALSLIGSTVQLLALRNINPQPGLFSLAGQAVQLLAGRLIQPQAGNYGIVGSSVDLIYSQLAAGYVLNPESGLFNITGSDVNLIAGRFIQPDAGNYQVFGGQAGLLYGRAVVPQSGSFALTGASVSILKDSLIIPQSGAYAITASTITLDYSGFVRSDVYAITVSYAVNGYAIAYAPNAETIAYKSNNVLIYYKPIED